jgi:hypothetical protein
MNGEKFPLSTVKKAIRESGGILAAAARRLDCTRSTVGQYIERHPELRAIVEACRDAEIDTAEEQLFLAVKRGEPWAIAFVLKTIGRRRGYVERQEIESASLVVEIVRHVDGREPPAPAAEQAAEPEPEPEPEG